MEINYKKIFLIQISAGIAETITFPIDYIKTQMQINKNKSNFHNILQNSIREKKIYNGLKPALLRHSVYTLLRISIFEELKKRNNSNTFVEKMFVGGTSGAIAQLVATPFDLLKVQYITDTNNKNRTIINSFQNIIQKNGLFGLYRGVSPNITRALCVNLGELATYDYSKTVLKTKLKFKESTYLHLICAGFSGFMAAVCSCPADVIKSRLMKKNSEYKGVIDCLSKTVKYEGPFALYKGFLPIWLRLAPWQLTFWISYEKLRYLSGLGGF